MAGNLLRDPICSGNKYTDKCTLQCKPGFGNDQVTYTCNYAGQWVSEDAIDCSEANIVEVNPVVLSEEFELPIPGQVTRVGFDFEGSAFESNPCLKHKIVGGDTSPTNFNGTGESSPHLRVTIVVLKELMTSVDFVSGKLLDEPTLMPIAYTSRANSLCDTLWSQLDSGGIGVEFSMVLKKDATLFVYNQRLEVFPARYASNTLHVRNVSVTSGEQMPDLILPRSAEIKGFGSFPASIQYRTSRPLPTGIELNPVTGTVFGRPVTGNESAVTLFRFEVIGRDEGSLDKQGGVVAAAYTIITFPTISYQGEIQLLTMSQQYDGGVPTVMGGAPPLRYTIKDAATLPPGLQVEQSSGRILGVSLCIPCTHARRVCAAAILPPCSPCAWFGACLLSLLQYHIWVDGLTQCVLMTQTLFGLLAHACLCLTCGFYDLAAPPRVW